MTNQQVVTFIKTQPVAIACGVLCVLLGIGIYIRGDNIPDAEAMLDQKSTLGQRINSNLTNAVSLPDQLTQLTAAREQIEARLVNPEEVAKNQQYFYKLEAETGTKLIELRQVSAGKKGPKVNYPPVAYSLSVRGTYVHVLEFLHRLEVGQRYCRINTAALTIQGPSEKDRAGEETLMLTFELLGSPAQ